MLDRLYFAVGGTFERHADLFAAILLFLVGKSHSHGQRYEPIRARTRKPAQQWLHNVHECDEDGHRVAGQSHECCAVSRCRWNHAKRNRSTRLDGDTPEYKFANALDRAAHIVSLAG